MYKISNTEISNTVHQVHSYLMSRGGLELSIDRLRKLIYIKLNLAISYPETLYNTILDYYNFLSFFNRYLYNKVNFNKEDFINKFIPFVDFANVYEQVITYIFSKFFYGDKIKCENDGKNNLSYLIVSSMINTAYSPETKKQNLRLFDDFSIFFKGILVKVKDKNWQIIYNCLKLHLPQEIVNSLKNTRSDIKYGDKKWLSRKISKGWKSWGYGGKKSKKGKKIRKTRKNKKNRKSRK